jgi:type II secretory pathway pseudopilin PulG
MTVTMTVTMSPRTRIPRSSRRAYTAVEVMLAMVVLMIGSAAVMSMQKSSIQSNLDARKLDIANSIAHTWLERLTTDATQWTLPSQNVTGASNFGNTKFLSAAPFGTWFEPPIPATYGSPGAEGYSPAFDIFGRDLANPDIANTVFCAHIKVDQLAQDANALPLLLRGTVIVFWQKQLVTSASPLGGTCAGYFDVAVDEAAHPGTWHIIYASTAIRKNVIQ